MNAVIHGTANSDPLKYGQNRRGRPRNSVDRRPADCRTLVFLSPPPSQPPCKHSALLLQSFALRFAFQTTDPISLLSSDVQMVDLL